MKPLNEPRNAKERDWASRLPADLRFGRFERGFKVEGKRYRYGAWNADGQYWLSWNTEAEFAEQLADCDFEAAAAQGGAL